jgi:hypothetical protein
MDDEKRWKIIAPYAERVANLSPLTVGLESDLPFSKSIIGWPLLKNSLSKDSNVREHLKVALMFVDSFLPPEDFKIIRDYENTLQSAKDRANCSDAHSHLDLIGRVIEDLRQQPLDKYVQIQNRIAEKSAKRMDQLKRLENTETREEIAQLLGELIKD